MASLGADAATGGGVAYWAHVGGFLTGVILVRLFAQPARVQQLQGYHVQFAPSLGGRLRAERASELP